MKDIHSSQCTTIYLKEFIDKNPNNIKEIIIALYSSNYNVSVATYHDSLCTQLQCGEYKDRSFDDIYYLCKSYLPTTTAKELIHELITCEIKPQKIFGLGCCKDISRIKLFQYDYSALRNAWVNIYDNQVSLDQYNSQWNWKELLGLLDIYSDEDLTNYREKYGIIEIK